MTATRAWTPAEGSLTDILKLYPQPLAALAAGEIPAIILRKAYPPDHCVALIRRFYERRLLYDPRKVGDGSPHRVDIGTSLGTHNADPEKFFAHAAKTHELFKTLFDEYEDPVKIVYDALSLLAPDKRLMTAREPEGRLYGPAIFRTYHAGLGHGPHYDSVSKRSKLFNYAVSRFQHQFAGVLCFQNSNEANESGEPFIYNSTWTPIMQEYREKGTFRQYAAERGIARIQVQLEPGDLYFFYSENVHEVPSVIGDKPRVVLAIFFAMSPDDEEIFVWS
ncbi:hypothetical protein HYR99_31440 [Candidatus Poribacteria bacterium]|nr:hypothetical protein [Candidatus Poribacteria bacterium]